MPTAWSPDSSMLLFRAGRNFSDDDELYVADVSGATPAPPVSLTSDTDDNALRWAWSTDGRTVVFYTTVSLSIARVACGAIVDGPHRITTQLSRGEQLSVEGDALVYLERIDAQTAVLNRADLTVMPPTSTPISEPLPVTFDSDLAWSPTAPYLAFRTESDLEVVDGTTGERSVVNGPLVEDGRVRQFGWSPDGQSIVYLANELDVNQTELFHVDMSGSEPAARERVSLATAHDLGIASFWWSSDSSHLAYTANQDVEARGELYAASRADGVMGSPVRLNPPLQRDGARILLASWSPDGSRLLYNSNDAGPGVSDGFVVGLATPGDATPINSAPDVFEVGWAPCPAR
jgi:Tol biopolymer transport system component